MHPIGSTKVDSRGLLRLAGGLVLAETTAHSKPVLGGFGDVITSPCIECVVLVCVML